MPSLSAHQARFEAQDTQVLGISVDSLWSHKAWAKSFGGLNYPLLSDYWPHGQVTQAYGVLQADGASECSLFLVDKEGIIRWIQVLPILEVPVIEEIFTALNALA